MSANDVLAELVAKVDRLEKQLERMQTVEMPTGSFTPLTTPLTSTAWDGDSYSTTGKTKIDLSAVFGAPAGIKAVLVTVGIKDSDCENNGNALLALSPNDTASEWALLFKIYAFADDIQYRETGVCPCDSNGDIYYEIVATGADTLDAVIEIWGYWQ